MNFCEFDKYAIKSYCAIHNVDESLNLGDITKVDETKLDDFNMICGGSPCQDFSISGKQKGSVWTCKECGHEYNPLTVHWSERNFCPNCKSENIEKTRSSLLVEYLRVVRSKKPNFGIYENVKNIIGKQFKDTFKMFTDELEEYGYNVYWKMLNSKNYGVPQNRERVYLLFIKKDLDNGKFKFPEPFDSNIRLKDILETEVDEKFYIPEDRVDRFVTNSNSKDSLMYDVCQSKREGKSREYTEYSPTLTSRDYKDPRIINDNVLKQVAQIYPNSGNPQAGRIYDASGISPAMDTCQGGNRMPKVLENKPKERFFRQALETLEENDCEYSDTVNAFNKHLNKSGICPTLTTRPEGFKTAILPITKKDIRIRKLTPKECFRLMSFSDEDFNAAQSIGISNSQLYKQAGNSIVVDVLYYIYIELYIAMPYLFDNLKLLSLFSGIGAFECALNRLYDDINSENFTKSQME